MNWKFQLNVIYSQEKIVQQLIKKLETVKIELRCEISKYLK